MMVTGTVLWWKALFQIELFGFTLWTMEMLKKYQWITYGTFHPHSWSCHFKELNAGFQVGPLTNSLLKSTVALRS